MARAEHPYETIRTLANSETAGEKADREAALYSPSRCDNLPHLEGHAVWYCFLNGIGNDHGHHPDS